MPIEVQVVTQPQFDAWVASKAPKPAPVTVAQAATPATLAPAAAQR
jgi:cytochrome c oxidase subunit 2